MTNTTLTTSLVIGSTVNNIATTSLQQTVNFYTQVFGYTVEHSSPNCALLICNSTPSNAHSNAHSNQSSFPLSALVIYDITALAATFSLSQEVITTLSNLLATIPTAETTITFTTFVTSNVHSIWDNAIASGATPIQAPFTTAEGQDIAFFQTREGQIYMLTSSTTYFN